jgi:hypothetical protein
MQTLRRVVLGCLVAAALTACGEPPAILVEPLQVVSWVPNRGAQCVAAARDEFRAAVSFSDDIVSGTLTTDTLYVEPEGGDPVPGSIDYDKATQTASLTVTEDLNLATLYELVVTDQVIGVERGQLIDGLRSPFTTISAGGCFQP